jgi:hypothetical protein
MTCDCIHKVQEKLREHHGDEKAQLHLSFDWEHGRLISRIPIYYTTRTKKKDGTLTLRPKKKYLFANYCPFCGSKIDIKTETSK